MLGPTPAEKQARKAKLLSVIAGENPPADAVKLATERWPNYDTDPDHGRAVMIYVQGWKAAASVSSIERGAGEESEDLEVGRYLSGYQQSAVARALVKVGKMGLNDTQAMLRNALSRQASALDTIRAAASAWDETMRAEVESILQCCGLHPSQPAGATSPTKEGGESGSLEYQVQDSRDGAEWTDTAGSRFGSYDQVQERLVLLKKGWPQHTFRVLAISITKSITVL